MSSSVRIGNDDKRKIEQISDLEGITQKQVISRAISFYQIAIMKRFLEQGNFEWTPELLRAFKEAQEWLNRLAKRRYKQLTKKKGETR